MKQTILKPIYLEKNGGLGNALRIALDYCSNELVARMDSDDVSYPNRFQLQLKYFESHPETDIVSGFITEFIGNEDNITGQRVVPESNDAIRDDMKRRCAINHVACMYKKKAVAKAGGYKTWYYNEDYYLWIRMMLTGAVFGNVQENLVNVRVGRDMSARRGGNRYFNSEKRLQKFMLDHKVISYAEYMRNVLIRFGGEVLANNTIRSELFKFTRKGIDKKQYKKDMIANTENIKRYPPFSVAMSVYKSDNAEFFDRALQSLFSQTVKPNEIVLVVDGPVPYKIHEIIEKYE